MESVERERIFYKPAMKSGGHFQLIIPKDAVDGLGIDDRDELKITIEKTWKKIPKTKRRSFSCRKENSRT